MKTESVVIDLPSIGTNGKQLHRVSSSREIVELRRLYVPAVTDDQVVVLGIYPREGGSNILAEPILLSQLNAMLRVAQFLYVERGCSAYVELGAHWPLRLEALCKIEQPWWHGHLDQAYRGWLKENPTGIPDDWADEVRDRINLGRMGCQYHECDDPAVIGTLSCAAHQNV